MPRFAFEKFPQADQRLTTQMKSVGEVMAIGRTFQESLQKALRGLKPAEAGLDRRPTLRRRCARSAISEIRQPSAERFWFVADAFRLGLTLDEVFGHTKIDRWFLVQIEDLVKRRGSGEEAWLHSMLDPCVSSNARGFRQAARRPARTAKRSCASTARSGRAPCVQARRYLRGRVCVQHRVHVLDLRRGVRGQPDHQREDHGARRRAKPDRSGYRV